MKIVRPSFELQDEVAHDACRFGSSPGGGLVKKKAPWARAAEARATASFWRDTFGIAAHGIPTPLHSPKRLRYLLTDLVTPAHVYSSAKMRQVLFRAQAFIHSRRLGKQARHCAGIQSSRRFEARHPGAAAGGADVGCWELSHGGRLAGAVGAQKPNTLPPHSLQCQRRPAFQVYNVFFTIWKVFLNACVLIITAPVKQQYYTALSSGRICFFTPINYLR